jgi:hypothetical protein
VKDNYIVFEKKKRKRIKIASGTYDFSSGKIEKTKKGKRKEIFFFED